MSRAASPGGDTPLRIVLAGAALICVAAVVLGVWNRAADGGASPIAAADGGNNRDAARDTVAAPAGLARVSDRLPSSWRPSPIAAEADVFRRTLAGLDAMVPARRRSGAHPRTLETYRAARAYPGAPPRIPHGLTTDEYRLGTCRTCHERGGYSTRFQAYAPVTPHPEFTQCLQCHVGDALLMDVPVRTANVPDDVCRQCHAPAAAASAAVQRAPLDWRPAAWPALAGTGRAATNRRPAGSPPPIPHDLQLRGDCRACHSGPAAVEQIRTTHPERTNCRQCHLPLALGVGEYVRAALGAAEATGGVR